MGKETELKYTPPHGFFAETLFADAEIKPFCGEIFTIAMKTEYFDTAENEARARGITLRRRLENGKSVLYAKKGKASSAALSVRGEWSTVSDDVKNMAELLSLVGAPTEQLCGKELFVTASVSFVRKEVKVTPHEHFSFMLSYDEGTFGEKAPFCEIELELICGTEDELVSFGKKLSEKYDLKAEPRSKYARALAAK